MIKGNKRYIIEEKQKKRKEGNKTVTWVQVTICDRKTGEISVRNGRLKKKTNEVFFNFGGQQVTSNELRKVLI